MAVIHWLKPVNGNFDKARNWGGGVVPGTSDDAFLDAPGTAEYTVKYHDIGAVNNVHIDETATLIISGTPKTGAALSLLNGLVNAGTLVVGNQGHLISSFGEAGNVVNTGLMIAKRGGYFELLNTIDNVGVIEVQAKSSLVEGDGTFTGGGTIDLSNGKIVGGSGRAETGYLTNIDNLIEGVGVITGRIDFTNGSAGIVDANGEGVLRFQTNSQIITNAGLIEATNVGVCIVQSTVSNTGTLEAAGGTLMLERPVTGSGEVAVAAGRVVITNADAAEAVIFKGASGTLELDQSQTYSGEVKDFSITGETALDLRDIAFVSANEATFSGTTSSGVLTVTDGTHTARITLVGNYTESTFVASSDGNGGVNIVDPTVNAPSAAHFVGTMATLGGSPAGHARISQDPAGPGRLLLVLVQRE